MRTEFTWDGSKAASNLSKHGVSFETEVFSDPRVLINEDRVDEFGNLRYFALGYAKSELLLFVAFVDRSEADVEIIRIISARKADPNEHRAYSDQFEKGN